MAPDENRFFDRRKNKSPKNTGTAYNRKIRHREKSEFVKKMHGKMCGILSVERNNLCKLLK